ncbi:MAG: hypothetical protein LBB68_05920 [Treponema sp.]|jgi:hypothetical protein|nr:hypothetical protein [Treponema sp.]
MAAGRPFIASIVYRLGNKVKEGAREQGGKRGADGGGGETLHTEKLYRLGDKGS